MTLSNHERAEQIQRADFVTSIRTLGDFEEALQCLHCALLEANSDQDRRNISKVQYTTERVVKELLLPARGFESALVEVESCWHDVCRVFEEYVPTEVWTEEVEGKTKRLFEGLREKLR